jgi:hypothetical protein
MFHNSSEVYITETSIMRQREIREQKLHMRFHTEMARITSGDKVPNGEIATKRLHMLSHIRLLDQSLIFGSTASADE